MSSTPDNIRDQITRLVVGLSSRMDEIEKIQKARQTPSKSCRSETPRAASHEHRAPAKFAPPSPMSIDQGYYDTSWTCRRRERQFDDRAYNGSFEAHSSRAWRLQYESLRNVHGLVVSPSGGDERDDERKEVMNEI